MTGSKGWARRLNVGGFLLSFAKLNFFDFLRRENL